MDDIFDNNSNEEFIDRPEEVIAGITLEEVDEKDELDWAEAIDMDQELWYHDNTLSLLLLLCLPRKQKWKIETQERN